MHLKLSDAANLGIHALVFLAEKYDSKLPSTTIEIAEKFNVSANHLSKVLQRLTKAGLVKSIRGPKGGFVLASEPEGVNLQMIYEAIDGSMSTDNHCMLGKQECDYETCVFGNVVHDVQTQVTSHFSQTTLKKLATRP